MIKSSKSQSEKFTSSIQVIWRLPDMNRIKVNTDRTARLRLVQYYCLCWGIKEKYIGSFSSKRFKIPYILRSWELFMPLIIIELLVFIWLRIEHVSSLVCQASSLIWWFIRFLEEDEKYLSERNHRADKLSNIGMRIKLTLNGILLSYFVILDFFSQ